MPRAQHDLHRRQQQREGREDEQERSAEASQILARVPVALFVVPKYDTAVGQPGLAKEDSVVEPRKAELAVVITRRDGIVGQVVEVPDEADEGGEANFLGDQMGCLREGQVGWMLDQDAVASQETERLAAEPLELGRIISGFGVVLREIGGPESMVQEAMRNGLEEDDVAVPNEMELWVFGNGDGTLFDDLLVERVDVAAGLFGDEPEVGVEGVQERGF